MFRIGFDIGGTNIIAGLVDVNGTIVSVRKKSFPTGENYIKVAALMKDMVLTLAGEKNLLQKEITSIGVGIPGSINAKDGVVIKAHNLQFYDVPFRKVLESHFPNIPVHLANDADAAALGEYKAGALAGCHTGVLITLGTGVGGGLILDGKLYRGAMDNGIEIGHMMLQSGGEMCTCGNRGCIESLCSATWLVRQGRLAVVEYPMSQIYIKAGGDMDRVNARLVIDAAKEGDTIASQIFSRYVDSLSEALVSLAVLLDPEIIAIGGGVSHTGDFLFEPVRKLVEKKNFFKFPYAIFPAKLGKDAGVIGAAMLGESK